MRVSLQQSLAPTDPHLALERGPSRWLAPAGPHLVIGGERIAGVVSPLRPHAASLFGPRGAQLGPPVGGKQPLAVCDTGHHRLLFWRDVPVEDHAPADLVIGQNGFEQEGRNAKGEPGAATLNVPTGVAVERGLLVVADAWNHRVLIWHGWPERHNQPADVVLGQRDFAAAAANRGRPSPAADTLHWCYGVAVLGERLVVADTGNRRVLIWNRVPREHGEPADLVLGQLDFEHRDENAGCDPGARGMRWPHSMAAAGGRLCVADAGNNRVLVWNTWPTASGQPADLVLGQRELDAVDHNRGRYWPDASTLNMPYGVACGHGWLVVADSANSRLLAWPADALGAGAPAAALAGQPHFRAKGDNRWQAPQRDTLCWPYGVAVRGHTLVVADSGNSRVLLWRLEP